MITTVHVQITWPQVGTDRAIRIEGGPTLRRDPVERLKINDPRVLLGAGQALNRRVGVEQVDLISAIGIPYFALALEDIQPDSFGQRYALTTLLGWLTDPLLFNVAFADEGGWKSVQVELKVEVMG